MISFSSTFRDYTDLQLFIQNCFGFVIISLLASVIYIINDINDAEKDRMHEEKKNRPIAAGIISVKEASVLIVILLLCIIALQNYVGGG